MIKSEFNKNFFKVLLGTGLAQIIGILFYPLLTRIYSPEDFSELGVYLSVVSILTVFATLKFEKAIILPRKDSDAISLMTLAIFSSIILSLLFLILFLSFNEWFIDTFNLKLSSYVYFIPLTILSRSIYEVFNVWFNRKRKYARLSKNRVSTSLLNNLTKIGFNKIFNIGALGLILSEVLTQISMTLVFGKSFFKSHGRIFKKLSKARLKKTLYKYSDFPKYSLPADLLNIISRESPVLLLSTIYGGTSVGFFVLTKRILDMPFTLISTSILEVFRQKANEDYFKTGSCREIYVKTFKKLLLLGFFPCLGIFLFAERIIPLIFGNEWQMAGLFAKILAVNYFFKFISSPLTYVFFISNKLKLNAILQLVYLALTILSIYFGYYFYNNIETSLVIYSVSSSILYVTYLVSSYFLSKKY